MRVLSIVSLLVAATLVSAGTFHTPHPSAKVIEDKYIVQYEDHIKHDDFIADLETRGYKHTVHHKYNLFHGTSIKIHSDHEAQAIAAMVGVKSVWPVSVHHRHKPLHPSYHHFKRGDHDGHQSNNTDPAYDPISDSLHRLTGVDILQKKYKLTGKGIKVGIVDTGVDYTHPAFAMPGAKAGCLGKGCRFVAGHDYVGEDPDSTVEDEDPMDNCDGHGTHVAGIVGANALHIESAPLPAQPFIGVAPDVTFGAYRVLGCGKPGNTDSMLAALERAYDDGMDIINLSAGIGPDYKNHPIAVLGDKLVARGISFVVAGGNDGSSGISMVGEAGLGDLATSVASFDNNYRILEQFTYNGEQFVYAPFLNENSTFITPEKSMIVPLLKADGSLDNGCNASQFGPDVKGNAVLFNLDPDSCEVDTVQAIGHAAGVAVHVAGSPDAFLSVDKMPSSTFPMVAVTADTVRGILAAHKINPSAEVTWKTGNVTLKVSDEAHESDFSSYGLDGDLRSKPDISAPGGKILSTYPLAMGSYKVESGTSMATPYIAGVHALLMQARRSNRSTLRGDQIRKILKNTATIGHSVDGKTIASVAKQGAGFVNALNAVLSTTTITPDHIDLLDSVRFQKTVQIVLKNSGRRTETYTLSHVPADSLTSYVNHTTFPLATPIVGTHHATVSFSRPTIRVAAGRSVKVTLHFQEPTTGDAGEFPIYSGFIVATPRSKTGIPLNVPYTGMKGDNSRIPILDTDSGFPKMVLTGPNGTIPIPGDYVYEVRQGNQTGHHLAFEIRLGSHTPDFQIRVVDPKTKKLFGFISGPTKVPMGRFTAIDNETGEPSVNTFEWLDGKVATKVVDRKDVDPKPLPSGEYEMVVAAQRKFTKGVYPRDYEVYEMGTIRVLADPVEAVEEDHSQHGPAASHHHI